MHKEVLNVLMIEQEIKLHQWYLNLKIILFHKSKLIKKIQLILFLVIIMVL